MVSIRVSAEQYMPDRPRLMSWDEVMKLAEALQGSVKTAYLLSARAGLRPGETVELRWGDVDLESRQITVSRHVPWGEEGPTIVAVARKVPIVEALARHLSSIRPTPRMDAGLVCPPPRRKKKNGMPGATIGARLGPNTIRAGLARAFKATGIAPGDFYDYGRHTFASLAALGGAPAWRLQEVLGHAGLEGEPRASGEPAALGA